MHVHTCALCPRAGRLEKEMALQKALSRLRNKEDRLNSNGTHQTKPITAPAIQQVVVLAQNVHDLYSLCMFHYGNTYR